MGKHVMPEGPTLHAMMEMGLHSWIPKAALNGRRVPVSRTSRELPALPGGRPSGAARTGARTRAPAETPAERPSATPGAIAILGSGAVLWSAGTTLLTRREPGSGVPTARGILAAGVLLGAAGLFVAAIARLGRSTR